VIKADLNAPIKKKLAVPLTFNFESLPGNGAQKTNSSSFAASELRSRLEQLLAEENAKPHSRPSSSVQMQTSISSRPQSAPSPKAKAKNSAKGSSAKFKGKVSGKIMAVVQRNETKNKVAKDTKVRNEKVERKSGKTKRKGQLKESSETSVEKEEQEKKEDEELVEESDPQNLMLQPDNLRSTKIKLLCTANENSEYFRDPSKSLALVKEWRKRLETTRASCEQMLEQLKAFRDPPAVRSSLSSLTNSYNLPSGKTVGL